MPISIFHPPDLSYWLKAEHGPIRSQGSPLSAGIMEEEKLYFCLGLKE